MSAHPSSTSGRAIRCAAGLAVLVAGGLALSGCSGGTRSGTTTPPPTVTTTVTAPTATSTPTSTASTTSTPASSASGGSYRSSRCIAEHLTGTLAGGEGAAGSEVVQLVLRNTGTASCTLQGWPGVSFIDQGGRQVGAAATLDRSTVHQTVTLLPGGRAQASLKIAQALNYPKSTCDPTTVRLLRVYPPGSTESIEVRIASTTACAKVSAPQLTVSAFVPGS